MNNSSYDGSSYNRWCAPRDKERESDRQTACKNTAASVPAVRRCIILSQHHACLLPCHLLGWRRILLAGLIDQLTSTGTYQESQCIIGGIARHIHSVEPLIVSNSREVLYPPLPAWDRDKVKGSRVLPVPTNDYTGCSVSSSVCLLLAVGSRVPQASAGSPHCAVVAVGSCVSAITIQLVGVSFPIRLDPAKGMSYHAITWHSSTNFNSSSTNFNSSTNFF